MMLACDELRVVPVTIHIAVSDVPGALNSQDIFAKGVLLAESLKRDFGIADPRIAVCGLNPHAGEDGQFGSEDQSIIAPAVDQLKSAGIDAFGPCLLTLSSMQRHETPMTVYSACITIRF